jgi:hypothetical protein
VALVIYALLGQRSFYKIDGELFLWIYAHEGKGGGYHSFYPHLLALADLVTSPFGFTVFESARALSAGGTALGVVGFHAISRRAGLDRREALLCSALCALCPAWMFFATIVEVHGSFVPFAALGVYALVRLVQRPGDGLAVIAGLAIGVAYLAHPTGVLLIAQLPLVAMLVRRGPESEADAPRVRLLRHGALVGLGSGLVVSTAPFVLEALDRGVAPSFPLRTLFATPGIATDPQLWTDNFGGELFIPYAPLVLTSLIALFLPATRRAAAWLWFAIVPYMIVSQLLILHGGEHGAYLLPVAWSMAVLALPLLRGRSLVIATLLVLSAAWGTARILKHDNPEPPTAYAEGFRDIAGERPVIAIGQQLDFAAHFLHLHDVQTIFIGKVVLIRDESGVQRFLSDLDRALADYARAGRRAFLSKGAFESLEIASRTGEWPIMIRPDFRVKGDARGPRALRQRLTEVYRLEPVAAKGFEGFEILPR